ncbi:dihydroxyacetone kinase subunit L [Halobacteriales archaeon QS_3_64_16]|nr:MAG: dihydroxyacetone kinase subunit L [Halobacteriales archaeon QS_3_64_16]
MVDSETEREALLAAISNVADRLTEEREYLTDLDSAIGDADHGANMDRGFEAALDRAESTDGDAAEMIKTVGTALVSAVGGASGPLYGGSIMSASAELEEGITPETTVAFAEAYLEKVRDRGDAPVGAKTMVDALVPAVHTYKKSIEADDLPPLEALRKAVDAAERGVEFTVPLRAKKGRASYLGWRSVGHQDPGATSTLLILEELLQTTEQYVDSEADGDSDARDATAPAEPAIDPDDAETENGDAVDGEGE